MQHKTVLLHETVNALELSSSDIVVDATFGSGGHAKEITKLLGSQGVYIGIDADTGYPTGQTSNDASTQDDVMGNADCESVFTRILQSAPSITTVWNPALADEFTYFTNVNTGAGGAGNDVCHYYLLQTVKNNTAQPTTTNSGNGFVYDPRIGQLQVFSNN